MKRIISILLLLLIMIVSAGCRQPSAGSSDTTGGGPSDTASADGTSNETADRTETDETGNSSIPVTEEHVALWDKVVPTINVYDFMQADRGETGTSSYDLKVYGSMSLLGTARMLDHAFVQTTAREGENFSALLDYHMFDAVYSAKSTMSCTYANGMYYSENMMRCAISPDELAEALAQHDTIDAMDMLMIAKDGSLDAPLIALRDDLSAHDLFTAMSVKVEDGMTVITGRGLTPAYADLSTNWMKRFLIQYGYSEAETGAVAALLAGDAGLLAEAWGEGSLSISIGVDAEGRLVYFRWRLAPFTPAEKNEFLDLDLTVTRDYETPAITPPADAEAYTETPWRQYFRMETPEMLEMLPDADGIITLSEDDELLSRQTWYMGSYPKGTKFRMRGVLIPDEYPSEMGNAWISPIDGEYSFSLYFNDDQMASLGGKLPDPWVYVEVVFHEDYVFTYGVANFVDDIRILEVSSASPKDPEAAAVLDRVLPTLDLYALIAMKDIPVGTVSYEWKMKGQYRTTSDFVYEFDFIRTQEIRRNENDFNMKTRFTDYADPDSFDNVKAYYADGIFYLDQDGFKTKATMIPADWAEVLAAKDSLNGIDPYRSFLPDDEALYTAFVTVPEGVSAHQLFLSVTSETDGGTGITTVTAKGLNPMYATLSTGWMHDFLYAFGYDAPNDGAIAEVLDGSPRDMAKFFGEDVFSLKLGVDQDGNLVSVEWVIDGLAPEGGFFTEKEELNLSFRVTCDRSEPIVAPPSGSHTYAERHWREIFHMETAEFL